MIVDGVRRVDLGLRSFFSWLVVDSPQQIPSLGRQESRP